MRAFKQLLRRLDDVQGMPFGQLAPKVGVEWNPKGPASNKSFAGDVVQAALGTLRNSSKKRDIVGLGLEIKTIPLDIDRVVRENTKVCALNFGEIINRDWSASHVYHKMRTTLFVPVVKASKTDWKAWYMWGAFIWLPTEDDEAVLKADYEVVRSMVRANRLEAITSKPHPKGPCRMLLPNTAGANREDTQTFELDGTKVTTKKRAWFLHSDFVQGLIDTNLEFSADARI